MYSRYALRVHTPAPLLNTRVICTNPFRTVVCWEQTHIGARVGDTDEGSHRYGTTRRAHTPVYFDERIPSKAALCDGNSPYARVRAEGMVRIIRGQVCSQIDLSSKRSVSSNNNMAPRAKWRGSETLAQWLYHDPHTSSSCGACFLLPQTLLYCQTGFTPLR